MTEFNQDQIDFLRTKEGGKLIVKSFNEEEKRRLLQMFKMPTFNKIQIEFIKNKRQEMNLKPIFETYRKGEFVYGQSENERITKLKEIFDKNQIEFFKWSYGIEFIDDILNADESQLAEFITAPMPKKEEKLIEKNKDDNLKINKSSVSPIIIRKLECGIPTHSGSAGGVDIGD